MRDPGLSLVDMLTWLEYTKAAPLTIVECGTIRNPSFEGHEDGLSTYHIAKWVDQSILRHQFISYELSHGSMRAAQAFLAVEGLAHCVTFGLGDAATQLQHFEGPIDLCYLDAGADVFQNLAQYRHAVKWIREPGMIVIDDVFDARNADRGLLTVPVARLEGRKVASVEGRLAVISFGVDDYPLPEGSRWLDPTDPYPIPDATRYCAKCHCAEHSPVHTGEVREWPNALRNLACEFVPREDQP